MKIKIKEEYLDKILVDIRNYKIRFTDDGCGCGDIDIMLGKKLFLHIYRSCRKSNSTPDNKWWHIHDFEFYSEPRNNLLEAGVPFENLDFQLDEGQSTKLIDALKEVSLEIWGEEFH